MFSEYESVDGILRNEKEGVIKELNQIGLYKPLIRALRAARRDEGHLDVAILVGGKVYASEHNNKGEITNIVYGANPSDAKVAVDIPHDTFLNMIHNDKKIRDNFRKAFVEYKSEIKVDGQEITSKRAFDYVKMFLGLKIKQEKKKESLSDRIGKLFS
jgi:ribosomal protein L25 (general stress protein Ctc)